MAHQPSCNDERFNGAINQHYRCRLSGHVGEVELGASAWQEYIIWQLIC